MIKNLIDKDDIENAKKMIPVEKIFPYYFN